MLDTKMKTSIINHVENEVKSCSYYDDNFKLGLVNGFKQGLNQLPISTEIDMMQLSPIMFVSYTAYTRKQFSEYHFIGKEIFKEDYIQDDYLNPLFDSIMDVLSQRFNW